MKKKISLLLAAIMVVGMIPATAFAVTTNTVSNIVTGGVDDEYTATAGYVTGSAKAPVLKMAEKNLNDETATNVTFKATLTNAEFKFYDTTNTKISTGATKIAHFDGLTEIKMLASNIAMITAPIDKNVSDYKIQFPIESVLKTDGEATITIDPMESVITAGTYKFANVVSGATSTTVEKTVDISEDGDTIKPIVITETSKGAMEWSANGYLKLKLSNGFSFGQTSAQTAAVTVSAYPTVTVSGITYDADAQEMYIKLNNFSAVTQAMTISISGIYVEYDDDEVAAGDIAEITVSGYDMTKQSVEVAVAKEFGVTFTAESKTLPVFYSGRRDSDLDTIKATMKEVITDSWLSSRKTTITFPDGVKIIDADIAYKEGVSGASIAIENNQLTITNATGTSSTTKAKIEFKFQLSIAPSFTGDITAVLGGSGIEEDVDAVIGTAAAPVTVEAGTNPVSIDYRNVSIGDIIITESFAGALEKDKTLRLQLENDYVEFDGTPTVEVVEGDIKIEKVDTDDGKLIIKIKTASNKTPAVLKVTGVQLFLGRSIPAGSYALKIIAGGDTIANTTAGSGVNFDPTAKSDNAYFQNSVVSGGTYKKTTLFDSRSITVVKDYVEVVTAGRDQDDSTFTTKISVTIGAQKLIAGTTEIALDVPAYIANGYTMLPVRGVTEALSTVAIVRWDDATKTVTISFGSRVVSMTVASKTMNINGVAVQMQAACEITDSRAFIPLRDLGYALGLNDAKINWDDATKTATLN